MAGSLLTVALALSVLLPGAVGGGAAGGTMTLVFQRTYDGCGMTAVAIGPDGSAYTSGLAAGEEIYPGIFDIDACAVRWSAAGDLLWQMKWHGVADEEARAIAVDGAGAAYVAGSTTSFGVYSDAFLVKFDAGGNLAWQRTWGGDREDGGTAVAVGLDGGVYVAGITQSFGTYFGAAAFLLKFTPDGGVEWERTWQVPGGTFSEDVATGADGAVYVVGNAGNENHRPFLAKFAASGDLVWDRRYIAPGIVGGDTARFRGIDVAPGGGVVAVGRWMPTFDGEVLVSRFTGDGALVWSRDWGGDSHDEAADLAVAADGTAYVVGRTGLAQSGTPDDLFVLKVLSSGKATEVRTWGGPDRDLGHDVVLGPGGDLFIAGSGSTPPYTLGSAPSQMSRVRGAVAVDADGVVGTPEGTLGTPDGTVSPLSGTVGAEGRFAAVLLRIRRG